MACRAFGSKRPAMVGAPGPSGKSRLKGVSTQSRPVGSQMRSCWAGEALESI